MEIANKFGNDKQNPDMPSDTLHSPSVPRWLLNNDFNTKQTLWNAVLHITPREMKPNTFCVLEVTSEDTISIVINQSKTCLNKLKILERCVQVVLKCLIRTAMICLNVSHQLFSCRCLFSNVTYLTAGFQAPHNQPPYSYCEWNLLMYTSLASVSGAWIHKSVYRPKYTIGLEINYRKLVGMLLRVILKHFFKSSQIFY